MMNARSLVSIVDDDESFRESPPDLLEEFGFATETHFSADEFLASDGISRTKCLVLDIAMPGMCGPETQQELNRREIKVFSVSITAQRDETVGSRLIERGAIACLIKPFSDKALLDALESAIRVK